MPPKKKTASGYKFASPLPKGIILEDITKKKWKLGVSIGKGGFGEIYNAQEAETKGNKYPFVIKIEPHENGPLFVEINFYIRNAKIADVESFKKENGLTTFGMPVYYGSGSHEYNNEKYRFLVMKRFGSDLLSLFNQNNKQFPVDTVFKIGLQIIDVLKYMHNRGYVHADIKAANLLLDESKDDQNKQVYLVDFGLASKYSLDKEFKANPKKAHDGTIEYLSRDAHLGVQTRRGDLEILAYNMLHWLGCKLPWENKTKDPKLVQNSKEENMSSVSNMIKVCFGSRSHPMAIENYLIYLSTLKFNTEPDYEKIKSIFISGLKNAGGTIKSSLEFTMSKTPTSASRSSSRNKSKNNDMNDEATTPKVLGVRKPKRGLAKLIKSTDDDDISENEVIPKLKSTKMKTQSKKNSRNSSSSEVDTDDAESSPVASPQNQKRKIQTKKKTNITNGTGDVENPIRKLRGRSKNVIVAKRKQEELSSISEQDTDNDNETPTKRLKDGRSKTKTVSSTNSNTEQTYSDSEQVTVKKHRKKPTTTAKLKKGQAMSLDDLTEGYTDAMKEVLLKKMKKENKRGKLKN